MLINNGDLFRLNKDYLQLDKGTLCRCLEDTDMDGEFCILSETPYGIMLIPVECVGYSQGDLATVGGNDEIAQ